MRRPRTKTRPFFGEVDPAAEALHTDSEPLYWKSVNSAFIVRPQDRSCVVQIKADLEAALITVRPLHDASRSRVRYVQRAVWCQPAAQPTTA
jgi:hypothetical protein